MSKNDYLIRLERKEDHPVVENLIREAFWNVYRPGCMENYLITSYNLKAIRLEPLCGVFYRGML